MRCPGVHHSQVHHSSSSGGVDWTTTGDRTICTVYCFGTKYTLGTRSWRAKIPIVDRSGRQPFTFSATSPRHPGHHVYNTRHKGFFSRAVVIIFTAGNRDRMVAGGSAVVRSSRTRTERGTGVDSFQWYSRTKDFWARVPASWPHTRFSVRQHTRAEQPFATSVTSPRRRNRVQNDNDYARTPLLSFAPSPRAPDAVDNGARKRAPVVQRPGRMATSNTGALRLEGGLVGLFLTS